MYRCYILIFPPYSFFPPEKWVYTQFSPRKNEYILRFPPGKMSIYWIFPRKTKYVLTHTNFFPHTSFSPSPILIGFFLCTLLYMYMVEDIIVKCGRKRVSTMMIVITKASMNIFEKSRENRQKLDWNPLLAHLTKCQSGLLPSHCVRRPSVVRPLTFYILIFFLRTTEHNLTKLGMNDP